MHKKRVYIVDDHPVVRQGISQFINAQPDLAVCGEAADAESAIRALDDLAPDIVIADLSLKGTGGIELTQAVRQRYAIPVLVLSMFDENFYAERAIRAGARGYIMKSESMEQVVHAVREILAGRIYLTESLKERLLDKLLFSSPDDTQSPIHCLTNRELDIFTCIGQGLSNRHIAEKLSLSIKTVQTYRERIKTKLNIATSAELIQYAVQFRLEK